MVTKQAGGSHAGLKDIVIPECGVKKPPQRPGEFVDALGAGICRVVPGCRAAPVAGRRHQLRVIAKLFHGLWRARVEHSHENLLPWDGCLLLIRGGWPGLPIN